jgi:alkanesulfonate monooxygenase SsuD/methylene tetrahydromethanopterin reductase-like flavin-dependent oxidoreductase (luciferase family)
VQFAISDRSRCRKIHTAITHWQPAAQRRRRDFFVCIFCVIALSVAEMRALAAAAPKRLSSGGPDGKAIVRRRN